jgi:hypothetical protein
MQKLIIIKYGELSTKTNVFLFIAYVPTFSPSALDNAPLNFGVCPLT